MGFSGGGTAYGQGGVESGSIVSLTGPLSTTTGCGIGYYVETGASLTYSFRLVVTATAASACSSMSILFPAHKRQHWFTVEFRGTTVVGVHVEG